MSDDRMREEAKERGGHALDRIARCVDGELGGDEEARVRAHCRECVECGRALADAESLRRLLESDRPDGPLRPFWPEIRDSLAPRRAHPARLRVGAALAVAAGLLIGLLLPSVKKLPETTTWQQETWTEVGTLLADATAGTLDEVYLGTAGDEGGDTP